MNYRTLGKMNMIRGFGRITAFLLIFSLVTGMLFFSGNTEIYAASRGSQLTGNDRRVYDFLTEKMHDIVEGKITSTELTLTYETLLGQKKSVITAAELGVGAVYKNGSMTPEAQNAYNKYVDFSLDGVMNAMLADYPYELFWFDKTVGYQTVGGTYSFDSGAVYLPEVAYTVKLFVSADYSSTGKTETTDTDPSRILQAAAAEKNVAGIIKSAAGLSDHEKLKAYAEKICEMVSYDKAAAQMLNEAYGDTSQLISIFDGDPSTNVICEGYSKAFKCLCDRTQFSSPLIECYLVSGMMSGGTGAGPHMWNLVVMDDGKTYMADITNCDEGSAGEGYALLLRGCPTGSASGYTISIPYREAGGYYYPATSISYAYDNITSAMFGASERTISTTDYEAGKAISVTPTSTPVPTATPTPFIPKITAEPTPTAVELNPTAIPTPFIPDITAEPTPTTVELNPTAIPTPFSPDITAEPTPTTVETDPTVIPAPYIPEITAVPTPTSGAIKPTGAPAQNGKPWEIGIPQIEVPDTPVSKYENSESSSSTTNSDGTVINKTTKRKNGVFTQEEYRKDPDGSSVTSSYVIKADGSTVYDAVFVDSDGLITPVCGSGKSPDEMSFMYFGVTEDFGLKLCRYVTKQTTATVPATVTIRGTKYDVSSIGTDAFKGCKALKKITIGKKTETIEKNAFAGLKKLSTVVIYPGSLKTVKKGAFGNVSKKTTLKIKAGNAAYKKIKALILSSGVSSKIKFKRVK